MRFLTTILALGLLTACAPTVPDSGVGFDNSLEAQRAREAALAGQRPQTIQVPPQVLSQESRQPVVSPAPRTPASTVTASSSAADIAAETAAALQASSANSGVSPVVASPSNPAPMPLSNPGISDENDFDAVASRQSIQSDAARIEQNRQQYEVVAPTALPSRSGPAQPNIVAFALENRHAPGTRLYSRSGINLQARAQRKCAGYASPDQAQIAFLSSGGPERDRNGLDPDGDGYACNWDPTPFWQAVKN